MKTYYIIIYTITTTASFIFAFIAYRIGSKPEAGAFLLSALLGISNLGWVMVAYENKKK